CLSLTRALQLASPLSQRQPVPASLQFRLWSPRIGDFGELQFASNPCTFQMSGPLAEWREGAMNSLVASRIPVSRRRTKRIALTASLKVSGKDIQGWAFNLTATATNLNRYGATLHFNRDLSVDSVVVIE